MKSRHILLACGVTFAGWLAIFGDKTSDDDIAMPVERSSIPASPPSSSIQLGSTRTNTSSSGDKSGKLPHILALQSRETLIGEMDADQPASLFASQSWTPPPPPPTPAPAVAPTAPPLPFKYLGKQKEEEEWQVFLGREDMTFIVKKNDVIGGLYKVQDIAPPSLTLLYLPLNQMQSLTIE